MALDPKTEVGDGDHVWIQDGSQFKIAVACHYGGDDTAEFMLIGMDWYRPLEGNEIVHSIILDPTP